MPPVSPVSLNLDKRQRAMLLEMGVQVWLPEAPVAERPATMETVAAHADGAKATGHFDDAKEVGHFSGSKHDEAPARPVDRPAFQREMPPQPIIPRQPAGLSVSQPASPSAVSSSPSVRPETQGGRSAAWLLGQAQILYADTAQADGARWLVLAETPPAALLHGDMPFFPFAGDAGQLLDNMLRAARLNRAGAVQFAPLVRQGAAAATPEFVAALAALIESARPDTVLVMGRLASQALLPTGEPFGKLRGRAHALHGARAIVTYDAPYLLRTPADKAKAWADLCLAMSVAASAA